LRLDLDNDALEDVGGVDDIQKRSAGLIWRAKMGRRLSP
jgi:hypothetical protein